MPIDWFVQSVSPPALAPSRAPTVCYHEATPQKLFLRGVGGTGSSFLRGVLVLVDSMGALFLDVIMHLLQRATGIHEVGWTLPPFSRTQAVSPRSSSIEVTFPIAPVSMTLSSSF